MLVPAAAGVTVVVPLVVLALKPDPLHVLMLAAPQVRVADWPTVMVVGLTLMLGHASAGPA
jgi:hypothetical protein